MYNGTRVSSASGSALLVLAIFGGIEKREAGITYRRRDRLSRPFCGGFLLGNSGARVEVSHSATEMIGKDEEIGKIDPLVAVQIETGVVG